MRMCIGKGAENVNLYLSVPSTPMSFCPHMSIGLTTQENFSKLSSGYHENGIILGKGGPSKIKPPNKIISCISLISLLSLLQVHA